MAGPKSKENYLVCCAECAIFGRMNGEEGRPYVSIGGPLNVCNTCPVKHYDNCPMCYGFGVQAKKYNGDYLPIRAADAIEKRKGREMFQTDGGEPLTSDDWRPCPNCHSTPEGIPSQS